jgi:hypothetical protein
LRCCAGSEQESGSGEVSAVAEHGCGIPWERPVPRADEHAVVTREGSGSAWLKTSLGTGADTKSG